MKKGKNKSAVNDDLPGRIVVIEEQELSTESEEIIVTLLFKWWLREYENKNDSSSVKKGETPS